MRITQVKIAPVKGTILVGYAEIILDDCFCVRDLKILRRAAGYYITMPGTKSKDGKYMEIAFGLDAATRKMIADAVIAEYERVLAKASRHS